MIIQKLKDIRNKILNPVRQRRREQEKKDKIVAVQMKRDAIKKLIGGDFYFSHNGYCVCCENEVVFEARDSWLRDSYFCMNCRSKPRERALMKTIENYYPNWKDLTIHEAAPIKGRGATLTMQKHCKNYLGSQYYPTKEFGTMIEGYRNEDLEEQTFPDESFDLVITSDVLEHIYDPEKAFKEIARTLKKGGAHIFTVPIINRHMKTEVWATLGENGKPNFLHTPEYHGNPVDSTGAPVTMHWGFDMVDFIKKVSGLDTDVVDLYDKEHAIMGVYNEVFVTYKTK